MQFQFEKFTATDTSFDARVTIRRTGQIGFNTGAINSYGLKDYSFVILYFDRQERAVGIQLTNEHAPGAIVLKKSDSNTYVRAKNFCDRYEIGYSKSRKFALRKDTETGFLYFRLDEENQASDREGVEGEETEE